MSASLDSLAWSFTELGDAIEALARRAALGARNRTPPSPPARLCDVDTKELDVWVHAAGEWLAIEAESVSTTYGELEEALERSAPSLWRDGARDGARNGARDGPRFFAVLAANAGHLRLLGPDGQVTKVATELLRSSLVATFEAAHLARAEALLDEAAIEPARRRRAARRLLHEQLAKVPVHGAWILRAHPASSFLAQARRLGLGTVLGRMVALDVAQYALMLAAWTTLGRGALEGRFDRGWLIAWALLLVTAIPFRLYSTWNEALLALGVGRMLKQRLLVGTLRLDPEQIRSEGAGELLGRVIESEVVESLATTGGLSAVMAAAELVLVGWVLAAGPAGLLGVAALAVWTVVGALLAVAYFRRRSAWTTERLGLTRELTERMVGHRTRLAQQAPERWHEGEDLSVERYVDAASASDRAGLRLSVTVGRGWLLVGIASMLPALSQGALPPSALAVGIGGVLLAERALGKLTAGFLALADAAIAWRVVAPLFHAAARVELPGVPGVAADDDEEAAAPLVESRDLVFRHAGRVEPVLRGTSLAIRRSDRLLLEGPSGGGKSTLAALLTGLRLPSSGLLLLRGLDRRTLGSEAWRRHVVAAPQFHENHVLAAPFAFNVLMGREWPPHTDDLREAEEVCRELGLGDLLERMPGGMLQMVGDTGWQLSHGERSRLFIARALLQRADLVIFDESFAALDPETLDRCLRCVLRRAPTTLVIAHP